MTLAPSWPGVSTSPDRPRPSHRWSWAPNGWFRDADLSAGGGGTQFVTVGVPDDFVAVRLGFANILNRPWTVGPVKACASARWAGGVIPVDARGDARPATAWTPLTFAMAGADDSRIVTATGAPATIAVGPGVRDRASGETGGASWAWSDWTPCASLEADPDTGLRVLMLRATVPGDQTVVFCNGLFEGYYDQPAVHRGFDYLIGGLGAGTDMVTDPAAMADTGLTARDLRARGFLNGSVIACIQALTRNPALVGIAVGDSHHAGASTTSQFNNFLLQTVTSLGRGYIGRTPLGLVNCAVGGMGSAAFFQRLSAVIGAIRPAYVVLPGWTFNDTDALDATRAAFDDLFLARLLSAAEHVRDAGAVPIWTTPFPRDPAAMTAPVLHSWQGLRQSILALQARGELVLDAARLLGRQQGNVPDGTYLPEMTTDAVHPDDRGHAVLSAELNRLLMPLLDLPVPDRPG